MKEWFVNKIEYNFSGMDKITVPKKFLRKLLELRTDVMKEKKSRDEQRRGMVGWEKYLENLEEGSSI